MSINRMTMTMMTIGGTETGGDADGTMVGTVGIIMGVPAIPHTIIHATRTITIIQVDRIT